MRTPLLLPVLLLPTLLMAACGDDRTEVTAGSPPPAATPPDVLLRVETGGGFVPVEVSLAGFPHLVVADGTAWTPGAQIAIYPPPAIPALQSAPLDDEDLRALADRIEEAAPLFDGTDFGQPPVSDLPTTTVDAVIDGEEHHLAVYALGDEFADEGLTEAQRAARQDVRDLISDLQAVVDDPAREWELGLTDEIRVSSIPVDEQAPADEERLDQGPPVAWPAEVPEPEASAERPFGCVVLSGDERDALLAAAEGTNTLTTWQLADGPHHIVIRPLFPGEQGCP